MCLCPLHAVRIQRLRTCLPQSLYKQSLYFTRLHLARKSEEKVGTADFQPNPIQACVHLLCLLWERGRGLKKGKPRLRVVQGHQGSFPSSHLTQHQDFPGILAPCMCNGEQALATQESGLRLWAPSSRASSNPDPHLSESGWRKLAAWVNGSTAGLHRSQLRAITGLRVAKGRQSHSLEAQAAMGRGSCRCARLGA